MMKSREYNHLKRHKIYLSESGSGNDPIVVHPKDWANSKKMDKKSRVQMQVWYRNNKKYSFIHFYDMKVFIDTPFNEWCHLVADTVDNLHIFAEEIGISRDCFRDLPGNPHYDCIGIFIKRALNAGAVKLTRGKLVAYVKKNYTPEFS